MTATSVELAIRNQTQVERLGAETRIHILAVIKPSNFTIPSIQHQNGPILSYPELTYPLDFESPSLTSEDPISNPANQNNLRPPSATANNHDGTSQARESPTRDLSTGSTIVAADAHPSSTESSKETAHPSSQWPNPSIARRDNLAKRTFLILKMPEPGYNPWDLGSSLLNWESVMGDSVLDWVLPFKRSPCCNHEEGESYYQVGPMVDLLKSKYGLIPESEIRAYGGRRREERLDPRDYPSAINANSRLGQHEGTEEHQGRRYDDSKEGNSVGEPGIEMGDINRRK